MRILVTGGAGFIGSHTVDLLLAAGHEVRVLDSLQPRVHPLGRPDYLPAEVEFFHGDVADPDALLPALRGVNRVVHLAAYQDYMPDFSHFVHTNAESMALLYELIVAHDLGVEKIVYASSQAVAGEGLYRCREHGVLSPPARPVEQLRRGEWEVPCPRCAERMQPVLIGEEVAHPQTAYGISKYACELMAATLGRKYGIPSVGMRYTYVQGPRNSYYNAYSGICRIFTLRLLGGLAPICFEDGLQQRDFVSVHDAAAANLLVLTDPRAEFQVFNVGGGRAYTVLEFAEAIIRAFAPAGARPSVPGVFRVGDTRHTVSDIARLSALGWRPEVGLEETLRDYLTWIQTRPDVRSDFATQAEDEMVRQKVLQSVAR
jgi:dTDP-L-rhamnose 4-epimerase